MPMDIGQAGLDLIKSFEKCVLHPYDDGYGYQTIGWGHLVKPGESFGGEITQEQADDLLKSDLAAAIATVNHAVTNPGVNQNEFDALVSFCFNAGGGNFRTSTLLRKFNAGDPDGAADQFHLWIHSNGQVSKGLIRRRAAEEALFVTPVEDANHAG